MFDSSLMLLQPPKPVLADAIWALTLESSDVTVSQGELQFVRDGGVLIHSFPNPLASRVYPSEYPCIVLQLYGPEVWAGDHCL